MSPYRLAPLFLALAATSARANLLTNGDFESQPSFGSGFANDAGYSGFTGSQIPGWTIEPGHGATIHNTVLYPTISGSYSLNTDGEGLNGHNADMYQDFGSTNGTGYQLKFNWENWVLDTAPKLDVSVEDAVTATVLAHGNYGILAGTHAETFNFLGTGNALRLRVKVSPESGYNDNTFIVDDFSVEAVPEPATLAALGLGLAALKRRRR